MSDVTNVAKVATTVRVDLGYTPFDDLIEQIKAPPPPQVVFDIHGVNKEKVFRALYKHAKVVPGCKQENYWESYIHNMINGGHFACCYNDPVLDFRSSRSGSGTNGNQENGLFNCRKLDFTLKGDSLDLTDYDAANGAGTGEMAMRDVLGS